MSHPTINPTTDHLPDSAKDSFWLESADIVLEHENQQWLAHAAVLGLHSPHLASLVSVQRDSKADKALPIVSVLPQALPQPLAEAAEHLGDFLAQLYRNRGEFQWRTVGAVLALADYFGATSLLSRADTWLCAQLRLPQLVTDEACQAFELAARHRLGGAMAVLLPWAVQCMARGNRCASIWYDGKQRCGRLQAAFTDCQLKCLVLDAYWWSRQAHAECPACGCRPADVEACWDTRGEWAADAAGRVSPPGGCSFEPGSPAHARAARHYAHLLAEAHWGLVEGPAVAPARQHSI